MQLKRQSTLDMGSISDSNRLIIFNKNTQDEEIPKNEDNKSVEGSSQDSNNNPGNPEYPFHIGQYYEKMGFSPTGSSLRTPNDD